VAASFLAGTKGAKVFGCDVDPDAVAFCQANLQGGEFIQIEPMPPLPYANDAFDAVYTLAVFPAFGPEEQNAWLPELRRVIAPGGLLLVSIQGWFSGSFLYSADVLGDYLRSGIFLDQSQWDVKDRVIEESYSRGIFQTAKYTWREWSKHFEVLEHIEGEINSDQDLVVMRRPM
jgi:SAM-dependent methyltransferase